jgi:LEA14-like dessication related protein
MSAMRLVVVFCALVLGCATTPETPQPPEVYVTGISPVGGGLLEQQVRVDLRIENPNNFDVRMTGIEFDLDLNGKPFARGRGSHGATLSRLGSERISIQATTTVIDVLRQIAGLQDLQDVGYAIRGRLYVDNATVESLPFERVAQLGDAAP